MNDCKIKFMLSDSSFIQFLCLFVCFLAIIDTERITSIPQLDGTSAFFFFFFKKFPRLFMFILKIFTIPPCRILQILQKQLLTDGLHCNFIITLLQHRCFLVNFAKIFKSTYFFFLCWFSFTNIHESQDCRGRGRAFH